jgi:cob(I)alamin adenosyltransferase
MGQKPKIYTKTGDDGTTGLFGGSRVKKDDHRLEAYGTLDELNSYIGLVRTQSIDLEVNEILLFIQNKLFVIGAKLASDSKGRQYTDQMNCSEEDILILENAIDRFENYLPELRQFILPGANFLSAYYHVARTVCRRAERRMTHLIESEDKLPDNCLKFINRLSDLLFILSRKAAFDGQSEETIWASK